MKSTFIWIKIIIVFCVLLTGFLFAKSFSNKKENNTKTVTSNNNLPKISPTELKNEHKKDLSLQANQEDKYKQELIKLEDFRMSGTLEDLINERNIIEQEWGKSGGEFYGNLSLKFLGVLTSARYRTDDDKALNLSQDFAVQALKKADTFDLQTEWLILNYLRYSLSKDELNSLQIRERRERVKLWLHALHRLKTEKDENFDPNNLPQLNVAPPEGVRVAVSGMSPESIEDPKLRAEYEAAIEANRKKTIYYSHQHRLRQNEDSIIKNAVKYISKVYSQPPVDLKELEELLNEYDIPQNIRELIKVSEDEEN